MNGPYLLRHISATGYRCFESIEIEFDPFLTVIAAENAGGKTAILELAAAALWPLVSAFQKSSGNLQKSDLRLVPNLAGKREPWPDGILISADLKMDASFRETKDVTWVRRLKAGASARAVLEDTGFIDAFAKQVRTDLIGKGWGEFALPVISYYGTGRLWKALKVTESRKGSGSQTEGYRDCLDSGSGYKLFLEWFRKMAYGVAQRRQELEANENPYAQADPEGWLDFVSSQIGKTLEAKVGVRGVRYDIVSETLLADLGEQGWLEVDQLSDGVRSMLALVGDISYRIAQLNAHLPAIAMRNVPGIVLIDEVDLHLHPTWQQTVLGSLRAAFPYIQWIVTTHSPQVLSTVPKQQIRILEWDGAKAIAKSPSRQTEGIESSRILAQVMETDPIPTENPWAKKLSRYGALVSQNLAKTSDEGLALRKELVDHYGQDDPVFGEFDLLMIWREKQGL